MEQSNPLDQTATNLRYSNQNPILDPALATPQPRENINEASNSHSLTKHKKYTKDIPDMQHKQEDLERLFNMIKQKKHKFKFESEKSGFK